MVLQARGGDEGLDPRGVAGPGAELVCVRGAEARVGGVDGEVHHAPPVMLPVRAGVFGALTSRSASITTIGVTAAMYMLSIP